MATTDSVVVAQTAVWPNTPVVITLGSEASDGPLKIILRWARGSVGVGPLNGVDLPETNGDATVRGVVDEVGVAIGSSRDNALATGLGPAWKLAAPVAD